LGKTTGLPRLLQTPTQNLWITLLENTLFHGDLV
jgi:hypothetical protein